MLRKTVFVGGFFIALILFGVKQADAQLSPEEKARLEAELAQVEAEQKRAAADLVDAQAESASLARDISVLNAKIKTAQLNIRAKTLKIQTLGSDIVKKQNHIEDLESHIGKGKATIAVILRKTNEIDDYSLPEILLAQNSLAGFFTDVDQFESVQNGLKSTFEKLRTDQSETAQEKADLESRQNAEEDAKHAIEVERANIQANEKQKQQLLGISKSNEKAYTSLIAQKQARASQIRAALFPLRDSVPIPFGQALQYANAASRATGVRPAFILAILTQESNLGSNVGSCYVTNLETGDGKGKNTGTFFEKVMKSPRDTAPFKEITAELGIDWQTRTVSCPIGGYNYYSGRGYGGAMGPAQFIPSTWQLIVGQLRTLLGLSSAPNPWEPGHAIMASAILLKDLGAGAGTYSSELRAACKYYGSGGSTCVYGRSVAALSDSIQRDKIDQLAGL